VRWLMILEELVAMEMLPYLSQYMAHLRNLRRWLFVAPILLLIAVSSYPFHSQSLLLLYGITLLAIVIAESIVLLVQTERNDVLSRITGGTPNKVDIDFSLIATFAAYLSPILIFVLAQFGETGRLVYSWFEPVARVLK
jgi:hypothetical protein